MVMYMDLNNTETKINPRRIIRTVVGGTNPVHSGISGTSTPDPSGISGTRISGTSTPYPSGISGTSDAPHWGISVTSAAYPMMESGALELAICNNPISQFSESPMN